MPYTRRYAATLAQRLTEPRRFIQVVAGPRQVGKTTLVDQVTAASLLPTHFASADEPTLQGTAWIEAQWDAARILARDGGTSLQRFAGEAVRSRGSSPKLQVLNTALMTAQSGMTLEDARADREYWGRLVESAVGAHLANAAAAGQCELFYWRDRNREVDFVARTRRSLTAIEVKSARVCEAQAGLAEFTDMFHPQRTLIVGSSGVPLGEFLGRPAEEWLTA